jgi:hypothetical protein
LRRRHACELGVTAVVLPPHAAHGRRYDVPFAKFATGRILDNPDRFNAQDAREGHIRRLAEAGKKLRTV